MQDSLPMKGLSVVQCFKTAAPRTSAQMPLNRLLTVSSLPRPPRREEAFLDQYRSGGGQSYRPSEQRERPRSPPRAVDSYRARSPPRGGRGDYAGATDSYRGSAAVGRGRSRSPPRRVDEYRRRSPSPRREARVDSYGGAARVDSYRGRDGRDAREIRREELPRDDLFRREPPPARDYPPARDDRDYRDDRDRDRDYDRGYGRSPAHTQRFRERTPLPPKRVREPSPIGSRGRRTPPPMKRERLGSPPRGSGRYDDYPHSRQASPPRRRGYSPDRRAASPPRGEYRRRSRSPVARHERVDPRAVDDWRRPRSPSPPRGGGYGRDYDMQDAGRESVVSSRRSSPPVHPSRIALQPETRRDPYEREPYRARSPEPARRRDSPSPRRESDYVDDRYALNGHDDRVPPPRDSYAAPAAPTPRAPPSGPAGYKAPSSSMAPPSGLAAPAPVSISAHSRAPAAPPSGPRAAPGGMAPAAAPRADFVPRGRGGFRGGYGGPPFRGGRGGGPVPSPAFGGRQESVQRQESYDTAAPPSGPRGSFSQSPATPSGPGAAFRPNSINNGSSATTYPRTQRFAPNGTPIPDGPSASGALSGPRGGSTRTSVPRVHPSISDLPKVVDGGQKADPVVDMSRLAKLQQEAEELRKIIEAKEGKRRKGLRDWERLSREVEVAGLRSELAEKAVRELDGDAMGGAGFGGFGEGAAF